VLADEIVELAGIPAPTFSEDGRLAWLERRLAGAPGWRHRDGVGSLIWSWGEGRPRLLLLAHVDTVFAKETPLRFRRESGFLVGPGIGDNAAAVVVVLHVVEELLARGPLAAGAVAFTVCEEGLGNLRGARAACEGLRPEAAIALEGHGLEKVIVEAVGSVRARVHVTGRRKAAGEGLLPRRSSSIISRFLASNLIIGLGAGLIVPIFSLWFFLKHGQREAFTGPLFALGAGINAFASLAAPVLARRHGLVRTGVALQGTATLLLLGMAGIAWLPAAAVLFLGRNALMNMTWPVMTSFLMGAVHPEERSSASAVVGISFRLPFAVSTTVGAAMMAANPDLPLLITAALYAVGTVAFWVFFRSVSAPAQATLSPVP